LETWTVPVPSTQVTSRTVSAKVLIAMSPVQQQDATDRQQTDSTIVGAECMPC
jgi:hypothetical protein